MPSASCTALGEVTRWRRILGGKDGPGGYREWMGIRGASNEVSRLGHQEQGFGVGVEANLWDTDLLYFLQVDYDHFDDRAFRVKSEEFSKGTSPVYDCYRDGKSLVLECGATSRIVYTPCSSDEPLLSSASPVTWPPGDPTLSEDPTVDMKDALANIRFLDLVPDRDAGAGLRWVEARRLRPKSWASTGRNLRRLRAQECSDVLVAGTHSNGCKGF